MSLDDLHIDKVLAGDSQAFRYFIQQYKDMGFSIAVSVVKDEFAAQEIVQDAFMKAYNNLSAFSRASSFGTWFYRIVTNEALMHLRKNKKHSRTVHTGTYEEMEVDNFPTVLTEDEKTIVINRALKSLAPNESLALRLFYLQEEKIKSVCEITGWSESNAKVILHRARKNMLALLKNERHG